jgi:hypothetical protein
VKKGRHRRFEEARSLKRSVATASRRCPECGAEPDDKHASWCLATEDDYDEILGTARSDDRLPEDGPPVGLPQRRTVGWGSNVT